MNMRLLFLLLLGFQQVAAQSLGEMTKQQKEFSKQEMMTQQRRNGAGPSNAAGKTSASNNFDVKYYRCEWEVDPAINYIRGKVTVYYVMTTTSPSITFDLDIHLSADSVKQRNNTILHSGINNTLIVIFPAPVNAGVFDSVSIYYKGAPTGSGFGSFMTSMHSGVPVMWTLSEPYGAMEWWPCKNGNDDKADSLDVIVTNPVAYKAVSNGLLQSETVNGTKRTSWWKHRYPIATYLVCFAVTNYTVYNTSVLLGAVNMPVQLYTYPEGAAEFQGGLPVTLDAMKLYNTYFGDYPFIKEKYGHTQFGWGGGMEHQTNSFVTNASGGLTAHELGHQWFGDKVTCASWKEVWLNEGFATHLATFFGEYKYPFATIPNRKSEIDYITQQPGGSVLVDDTTDVNRIFDYRLTYLKGSHLVYMLRWKLGDSVFFRGIRNYLVDPKIVYGFATTNDLKRNLEQASGQNLTNFFDQWYKGQGHPSYRVEWTPVGNSFARIRMLQTTSHASVPFFQMPVALLFKNATQQKTIVVDNKSNGEIFFNDIGFVADTVIVDPEYWLISKDNVSVKVSDAGVGQHSVQVYPNPVGKQFYVYLRNFSETSADINLYTATGQLLYSNQLSLNGGAGFWEIPSANLPAGAYSLRVKAGGFKYAKQLLKP